MIELGGLLLLAVVVLGLVVAAGVVLKTLFWLVLLPIRLVFWVVGGLLILPLLLIKLVFGGLFFLIVLPILAIVFAVVTVAVAAAVLIPAIPVIFLAGVIWYLVRPEPAVLIRS